MDADLLAQLEGDVGTDRAPGEPHEGIADDATGRSTGAAPITASVTRVLFTPRNAPATMMPTTMTISCWVNSAITSRSHPKRIRQAIIVGMVPKRRCSTGATTTEVKASRTPHPKKIQPICMIPALGRANGPAARMVKKPRL